MSTLGYRQGSGEAIPAIIHPSYVAGGQTWTVLSGVKKDVLNTVREHLSCRARAVPLWGTAIWTRYVRRVLARVRVRSGTNPHISSHTVSWNLSTRTTINSPDQQPRSSVALHKWFRGRLQHPLGVQLETEVYRVRNLVVLVN